jgi:photosystem II stability/assembly factor-like uncharacterized protein
MSCIKTINTKDLALLFVCVFVLAIPSLMAQQMQSNEHESKTRNFLKIQEAHLQYFDSIGVDQKGNYIVSGESRRFGGYKQFKRWEWFWQQRIDPSTGLFPETSAADVRQNIKNNSRDDDGDWSALGPFSTAGGYSGIGRINAIGFRPGDNNTIYIASPSGGVWKTLDGGSSWTPISDNNAVIGASDIVVIAGATTDSDIVYIATGDRDMGTIDNLTGGHIADNHSIGVLKSTDGGSSWTPTGLTFSAADLRTTNRLLLDPEDNNTLFAATSDGLYKTSNAGDNWVKINANDFVDLEFNPANSQIILASVRTGGKVFRSHNGGSTWDEKLAVIGGRRTEMAVSANDPMLVYVVIVDSDGGCKGVWKSTDAGLTFFEVYEHAHAGNANYNLLEWRCNSKFVGGQGHYDLAIAADPNNANIVYVGGINTYKSVDGGNTFSIINHWNSTCSGTVETVHADKHCLEFQNGTSIIFEGNDGGIYKSVNGGINWTDLSSNLVISQFYRIAVAQTSADDIIGGLQDNGTKSMISGSWTDVKGADGMDCGIDYTVETVQYGSIQNGSLYRTTNHWASDTYISGSLPSGAWLTPFVIDPNSHNTIYFGPGGNLYKSTNRGTSWSRIGLFSGGDLWSLDAAPSNSDYIYVAQSDAVYKTEDSGDTWSDITGTLPVATSQITSLKVSKDDPDHLWVCFGNYNTDGVYESTNGGSSWSNISAGLPEVPVMNIIQNHHNWGEVELYVATDVGVFQKIDAENWSSYNAGLPNVVVTDLDIYYDANIYYDADEPDDSKIRIATYGRGVWESELPPANICYSPSDLIVDDITTNSARLSWTSDGAALWNIEYGPDGFEQGAGTLLEGIAINPYILTGLTHNTNYDVYLQADCGLPVGASRWIGPVSFTTARMGTTCDFSHIISSLPFSEADLTTLNSGNNYNMAAGSNTCGTGYMEGEEYVFQLALINPTYLDIVVSNTGDYTGLFVLDGCPDDPLSSCVDTDYQAGGNPSLESLYLAGNETYYIIVSTASLNPFTAFDMAIEEVEPPAETLPFIEGFENGGSIPIGWSQSMIEGAADWIFQGGGESGHPPAAFAGSYNAFLFTADTEDDITRLISPVIDLSPTSTPLLSFVHTQEAWNGQDELRVLYRTASTEDWTQLADAIWIASISDWTAEQFVLPDPTATYQLAFEGNAKHGYGVCIDNVVVEQPSVRSWSGMMNSDWNQPMNWNQSAVPTAINSVSISGFSMNYPVITGDASCLSLSILDGATLTINPNATLTVGAHINTENSASLLIQSDASGSGSLLHNGEGAIATVERYITGSSNLLENQYHMVAVPLTAANNPQAGLFMGSYLFYYNQPTQSYMSVGTSPTTALDVARGYLLYYPDDNTTFSFEGVLNNGAFEANMAYHSVEVEGETYAGFNLVPNPYPSVIDWDAEGWIKTNVNDAIWIWNPAMENYAAYGSGAGVNGASRYIPSGQSFFVQAAAPDPVLGLSNDIRTHHDQAFYKIQNDAAELLRLKAEANNRSDEIILRFVAGADADFGLADVHKVFGNPNSPQLYSNSSDSKKLSINALDYSNEVSVTVGFQMDGNHEVHLDFNNMESFNSDAAILFEDLIEEQTIDLRSQSEYSFYHSGNNEPMRFLVHFKGLVQLDEKDYESGYYCVVEGNSIHIHHPGPIGEKANIQLYGMLGQKLFESDLTTRNPICVTSPSKGLVILQLIVGDNLYRSKVIVH